MRRPCGRRRLAGDRGGVAAELGLPYACIPAGTRNHLALDLGVDRDDVVGALDAVVDGGERRRRPAEVNGRVFVNNVSLGVYAEAVQQRPTATPRAHPARHRPRALGPEARAQALSWTDASTCETAEPGDAGLRGRYGSGMRGRGRSVDPRRAAGVAGRRRRSYRSHLLWRECGSP